MNQSGSNENVFGETAPPEGAGGAAESIVGLRAEGELDLMMGEAPRKGRSGTVILVAVVVLAVGSLFSMRTLTKGYASQSSGATDSERTVDKFISSITDPKSSATAAATIRALAPVETVERDAPRDPFIGEIRSDVVVSPTASDEDSWRLQVERASEKLQVSTMIAGRMASINRKIVRLGGTIVVDGVEFTLVAITTDAIAVETKHAEKGWAFRKQITVNRGFRR